MKPVKEKGNRNVSFAKAEDNEVFYIEDKKYNSRNNLFWSSNELHEIRNGARMIVMESKHSSSADVSSNNSNDYCDAKTVGSSNKASKQGENSEASILPEEHISPVSVYLQAYECGYKKMLESTHAGTAGRSLTGNQQYKDLLPGLSNGYRGLELQDVAIHDVRTLNIRTTVKEVINFHKKQKQRQQLREVKDNMMLESNKTSTSSVIDQDVRISALVRVYCQSLTIGCRYWATLMGIAEAQAVPDINCWYDVLDHVNQTNRMEFDEWNLNDPSGTNNTQLPFSTVNLNVTATSFDI